MENLIQIGAVSYLNTKPLLWGIERTGIRQQLGLVTDYPSRIAQLLVNGEIDMGLIPVAAIPHLKDYYIDAGYCIGAVGPVASVCIFSEEPLEKIDTLMLDYQSRTSVALAQLLLKKYWKKQVEIIPAYPGYEQDIKGCTAGVVIGDRALQQLLVSRYRYDLAEAWLNYTGLPFVFAAWVANQPLPEAFIAAFDDANELGLHHLPEVIAENPFPAYDLHTYYTQNISYKLDEEKRKGLNRFLKELGDSRY